MTGFLGQKLDFIGEDGAWYSLIADRSMHINMRVTSPVADLPEITYITGMDTARLAPVEGDFMFHWSQNLTINTCFPCIAASYWAS